MTDLAKALEDGIQAERLRQRAPELERELAFTKAGVPLDKPYGRLFAESYDGALHPDDIAAAWHRTMLDTEPPQKMAQEYANSVRAVRERRDGTRTLPERPGRHA